MAVNVYESPAVSEERVANSVVAQHPGPDDVSSVAVEFGVDHSDIPAMWLVFTLRLDIEETQDTYKRIYAFADAVRPELRDAGVERFAYVRVRRPDADLPN